MSLPEPLSRTILQAAIDEQRCGELLDTLFNGGGCTYDPITRRLILITAEQVNGLTGQEAPGRTVAESISRALCAFDESGERDHGYEQRSQYVETQLRHDGHLANDDR